MLTDTRAEIIKHARRPAVWTLLATAVLLTLTFAYLIPYAGYNGTASGAPNADRGLASMLPEQFVGNAVAGLPVFLGALALIFGVLVVGNEYGFDTLKTVLTQQPSRVSVYGGKLVAVAVGTLIGVLVVFAGAAAASAVIATLEAAPANWPSLLELAEGVGTGWLVATMWATLGAVLAIMLRSVALPVGIGLVWLLAVQNLLTAIAAPLLDWIADVNTFLPGPNAGALAAALGAQQGTPGVDAIVGVEHATAVIVAYLVVFVVVGGWVLRRRDVA